MPTQNRSARFDAALAALAERQHGVVARRQLAALGLGRTAVAERVRRETLRRIHRGVYAVGHRHLTQQGRWLAAVLAVGPDALLSHRDAAALHGIRDAQDGRIDVSTTRDRHRTDAINVHHTTAVTPLDATIRHGIPVTTVVRTLVDLASVVSERQLAHALSEADRTRQLDLPALDAARGRTRGRAGDGHANLARALERHAAHGIQLTRSELERDFVALLDAHDLPRPQTNQKIHGHEVDAAWPRHRLVVELDGWEFHRTRAAFERDRAKRTELQAHGWRVVAFTHRQLTREPAAAAAQLRRLLAATSTPPPAPPLPPAPRPAPPRPPR